MLTINTDSSLIINKIQNTHLFLTSFFKKNYSSSILVVKHSFMNPLSSTMFIGIMYFSSIKQSLWVFASAPTSLQPFLANTDTECNFQLTLKLSGADFSGGTTLMLFIKWFCSIYISVHSQALRLLCVLPSVLHQLHQLKSQQSISIITSSVYRYLHSRRFFKVRFNFIVGLWVQS